MKSRDLIIAGCVSLLALGSVVALAQSVPQDITVDAQPAPATASPEQPSPMPSIAPITPSPSAPEPTTYPVEDAPVDVPSSAQSDWAPDINLDAQSQADAAQVTRQRRAKPRKILSDAGENVLGTNSWSSSSNSEAAQAALLARASRRERAIDPVKRSELTKLARVMGALHALRVSCAGRDDQTYRSRMATMLDLEAPDSGGLRDPLVDAFNGGFQVYGRGASECPTDARVQEASLAKDGYGLARTLSTRYRPAPVPVAVLPPATQPRKNPAPKVDASAPGTPPAQPASQPQATHSQATQVAPSWNNSAKR